MFEELVKMLREHYDKHCPLDRASGICGATLASNAADAIEELNKCLSESISKTKFEIAKQIIKEYYHKATCGIFDCRGWTGDVMYTIYHDGELTINICYDYEYFEVFGLSHNEFIKLERFYEELGEET